MFGHQEAFATSQQTRDTSTTKYKTDRRGHPEYRNTRKTRGRPVSTKISPEAYKSPWIPAGGEGLQKKYQPCS